MTNQTIPTTHLTRTLEGWTLIHQGMPLLRDNSTFQECLTVADKFKLRTPAQNSLPIWVARLGRFGTFAEATDNHTN